MCKLKSGIVLRDRVFLPEYDSHTDMLEELGIKDDYFNASKTFVRFEYSPINNDVFSSISEWKLKIDQDIVPDWFDEEEYLPQIVEAVEKWVETHIHIGVDNLKIDNGKNHYIKDCKDVVICGSATVKNICDSATVKNIYGSATVEYIYGSATVKNICDSATVKNIYGSATVENIYGSATVKNICDSATVKNIYGSATVEYIYGSATVEYIYGSATVEKAKGFAVISSSLYTEWKNKGCLILTENATFRDCQTKTIYQSGDWKLLKYDEEIK